jgi:hypothetical protein
MKLPILLGFALFIIATSARAQLAGEYADRNYQGGNGVFQMSIEGGGAKTAIWFSAVRNDGHGAAPEGKGWGKTTANGIEFQFDDSCKNLGTGTITKSGDDIVVSMRLTRTANKDCAAFYGSSMKLKRQKK